MSGKIWCSQQLNALTLYLSRMYCFNCGRLSTVGAQGRDGGVDGGRALVGQLHGASPSLTTPELEQFGRLYTAQWAAES